MELFQMPFNTWEEVKGQAAAKQALTRLLTLDKKDLPGALLLAGASGSGKTSTAKLLSRALLCTNREPANPNPCNQCDSCKAMLQTGSSNAVHYFSMANLNGVTELREIIELSKKRSFQKFNIFLIDEIHQASRTALDALLIPLDEPVPGRLFIFCTTEASRLPVTFTSRCTVVNFPKLTDAELKELLTAKGDNLTKDQEQEVIQASNGNARQALQLCTQVRQGFKVGELFSIPNWAGSMFAVLNSNPGKERVQRLLKGLHLLEERVADTTDERIVVSKIFNLLIDKLLNEYAKTGAPQLEKYLDCLTFASVGFGYNSTPVLQLKSALVRCVL